MNKRKYKKFVKKFYKKSYYNVRLRKIINIINMKYTGNYIPYIVDSKKGNLKHPYSINVLVNCYPVSCEFNKNKRQYNSHDISKFERIKEYGGCNIWEFLDSIHDYEIEHGVPHSDLSAIHFICEV